LAMFTYYRKEKKKSQNFTKKQILWSHSKQKTQYKT
jgi:hypothetical protein